MTDALKTVVLKYHGNGRRHGGYSRTDNKMCEVFVTRLVPDTTVSDVLFFVKPRVKGMSKLNSFGQKDFPRFLQRNCLTKIFWKMITFTFMNSY